MSKRKPRSDAALAYRAQRAEEVTAAVADHYRPVGYERMSKEEYRDGVDQMLRDLADLANNDGCIAAAWAVGFIVGVARSGGTADESIRN